MTSINMEEILKVLKENQSRIISGPHLFRQALVDARDFHYRTVIPEDSSVNLKTQVIVSKLDITSNNKFELWVEFSIPRQDGNVVGTHVYNFGLDGVLVLKNSYGTVFKTEKIVDVHSESETL